MPETAPPPQPPPPPSSSSSSALENGTGLENSATSLRALCDDLNAKTEAFLKEEPATELIRKVQAQTRHSLRVIDEVLERYPLSALSFSYNGGKDCLVLLILYLAALSKLPELPLRIESIYIVPPHSFPQVDAFVAASGFRYHLSQVHLRHESMRDAFDEYLKQNSNIKAIFVGTRRTDPHGAKLTNFDMTDHGWPSFMRLHPVIDWHYTEIWAFIKALDVPYCELYDLGYTSLGGTKDTFPNPALRIEGTDKFRPAFELTEDDEERLGRERKK